MRCLASILALVLVHPALAADLHVPGDHDTIQAAMGANPDRVEGDQQLLQVRPEYSLPLWDGSIAPCTHSHWHSARNVPSRH